MKITPSDLTMIAGLLLTVMNMINMTLILKDKAKAPNDEQNRRITLLEDEVKEIRRQQSSDFTEIDNIKDANKILIKSMSALLSHGIEGNNLYEMKLAREELNNFLYDQVSKDREVRS